jgi:hypothetical protein
MEDEMIKVIEATANEALANMVFNLVSSRDAKANRVELQKWLEALDAPITYSNEDIDRQGHFAEWIQALLTR